MAGGVTYQSGAVGGCAALPVLSPTDGGERTDDLSSGCQRCHEASKPTEAGQPLLGRTRCPGSGAVSAFALDFWLAEDLLRLGSPPVLLPVFNVELF